MGARSHISIVFQRLSAAADGAQLAGVGGRTRDASPFAVLGVTRDVWITLREI